MRLAHGLWRVREEDHTFTTVALPLSPRLSSGRWCYEVTMCSEEVVFPQIGWAREASGPVRSLGSATTNLVARTTATGCKLWHGGGHDDFGRGSGRRRRRVLCDLDEGIILFTVNGHLTSLMMRRKMALDRPSTASPREGGSQR